MLHLCNRHRLCPHLKISWALLRLTNRRKPVCHMTVLAMMTVAILRRLQTPMPAMAMTPTLAMVVAVVVIRKSQAIGILMPAID